MTQRCQQLKSQLKAAKETQSNSEEARVALMSKLESACEEAMIARSRLSIFETQQVLQIETQDDLVNKTSEIVESAIDTISSMLAWQEVQQPKGPIPQNIWQFSSGKPHLVVRDDRENKGTGLKEFLSLRPEGTATASLKASK